MQLHVPVLLALVVLSLVLSGLAAFLLATCLLSGPENVVARAQHAQGVAVDGLAAQVYLGDLEGERIARVTLEDGAVFSVAHGLQQVHSIALDAARGKVYWTDAAAGKVQRASYDGAGALDGGVEDIAVGLDLPAGIAVVPAAAGSDSDSDSGSGSGSSSVFWADRGSGRILRADVPNDAINSLPAVQEVASTASPDDVFGVAVDAEAGHVYWTLRASGKIQRGSADGSTGFRNVLETGLMQPEDIVLDGDGKMYWSDPGSGKIQRADVGGTNREDIIVSSPKPRGLALDTVAGKLYWVESSAGVVRRASIDGECLAYTRLGNELLAIVVLGAVAGVCALCCCASSCCLARKRKPAKASDPAGDAEEGAAPEQKAAGGDGDGEEDGGEDGEDGAHPDVPSGDHWGIPAAESSSSRGGGADVKSSEVLMPALEAQSSERLCCIFGSPDAKPAPADPPLPQADSVEVPELELVRPDTTSSKCWLFCSP